MFRFLQCKVFELYSNEGIACCPKAKRSAERGRECPITLMEVLRTGEVCSDGGCGP